MNKNSILYNCKCNRAGKETLCSFQLYIFNDGSETTNGEHGPDFHPAGLSLGHCQEISRKRGLVVDYSVEMGERAEELALENLSMKPSKIWKIIQKEFNEKYHLY